MASIELKQKHTKRGSSVVSPSKDQYSSTKNLNESVVTARRERAESSESILKVEITPRKQLKGRKDPSDLILINQSGKIIKKLEQCERVILEEPFSIP